MGYVYGSRYERRCLFSCLHLDRICDFLFGRVFSDGKVIEFLIFYLVECFVIGR